MDFLFAFWTWVYGVAAAVFGLLVLMVVPLGARDLVRLFRQLRGGETKVQGRDPTN